MRYLISPCLAFAYLLNIGAAVQGQPDKPRCVVTPADQALVAVAFQPDSPLIFEDVKALSCIGRHGTERFRLRNRGTKPIRGYAVAGWSSAGTGFKSEWGASAPGELILPGQLAPSKAQEAEILPLTKDLREKLKLSGPLQGVMILIVVSVEYADGTRYRDESASKALEDYFEKVGAKIH